MSETSCVSPKKYYIFQFQRQVNLVKFLFYANWLNLTSVFHNYHFRFPTVDSEFYVWNYIRMKKIQYVKLIWQTKFYFQIPNKNNIKLTLIFQTALLRWISCDMQLSKCHFTVSYKNSKKKQRSTKMLWMSANRLIISVNGIIFEKKLIRQKNQ